MKTNPFRLRTLKSTDTFTILYLCPQRENQAADGAKVSILFPRPHLRSKITKSGLQDEIHLDRCYALRRRGPDG
jgi:hypothetical protein